ncbi:TraG family conjugative transposon ATPase [Mucilaginibacter sp. BJC16-A38]|uniref:TraG family conjugative transposon ATPase n=1 Tax=Mucilaginibacter phenanthrenivorans TaxID=1234842 RepID=UPI0021578617|nr:TraG family conjugative transposon ATPase [Mucilaginibacter phenanthrenivorans]MCR8560451.1 TraG family conjugative transposon ATPase [Mucilaginibacter phenanthrenivorans]
MGYREAELADILPLVRVENGAILSAFGDVTIGFRAELPEIFTLSDRDYEAYHQAWVKAIRLLPESCIFHKQDWFTEGKYLADFEKNGGSFLSHSSERFFNEREYLDHSCYIFLTQKPKDRKLGSSAFSNLLRKGIVPQQVLDGALYKDFLDAAGQFVRVLSDSGFVGLVRLGDDLLAGTEAVAGVIERYCLLVAEGERPGLADIRIRDGLQVGNKVCELYTLADVADLPPLCGSRINYDRYSMDRAKFSIGFASPLGQLLPCNHILNQYVFTGNGPETIKKLEAKKLRLQSLSGYSRENAIARDAVNDFLNEAIGSQRLPVKAHFNVLCWREDAVKAGELKNLVGSAMAQLDAVARLETVGAPQVWFAGMPGNEADFPMNETFDTFAEQAACFFNLEANYRSSVSPFGIRMGDRLTGRPVQVDISDEPMRLGYTTNRNKFIIGPSGSGKSFFTNHLVRSYFEQGAHVVLVDVGHSYKGLCELVGGYYFTYSEDDPIRFNPFYLGEGDVLDTEKKESIKTLLLALWKKDDEVFRRSEYVALSNALTGYFAHLVIHPDVFPCFNTFYEYLREEYVQVLSGKSVKEKDFDVQNFLYVLNPYYRGGEFDYLLNARENLDLLHQPFIVIELDNIKDHPILFPVVTLVLMEMFISKMRKLKGVRKLLLIEECWKAIAKEGMAEYIKYLFKTVRKFFGEAVVVTQEVEDIISSPVVKQAIINNSDCKILLDQSKYQNKFDQIQELLGLTDKDKALILSMNKANDPKRRYKEVAFIMGPLSRVYRTEVSLEEYLAYTTEESEQVKVRQYAKKYGGIQKGIAVLAEELRNKH